jgi:hypothetical protein
MTPKMEKPEKLPRIIEQDPWLMQAADDIIARQNRFRTKLSPEALRSLQLHMNIWV